MKLIKEYGFDNEYKIYSVKVERGFKYHLYWYDKPQLENVTSDDVVNYLSNVEIEIQFVDYEIVETKAVVKESVEEVRAFYGRDILVDPDGEDFTVEQLTRSYLILIHQDRLCGETTSILDCIYGDTDLYK